MGANRQRFHSNGRGNNQIELTIGNPSTRKQIPAKAGICLLLPTIYIVLNI